MRVIKYVRSIVAWLAAFLCAIWTIGALYFDFPKAGPFAAILFVIALLAIVIFVRKRPRLCRYAEEKREVRGCGGDSFDIGLRSHMRLPGVLLTSFLITSSDVPTHSWFG